MTKVIMHGCNGQMGQVISKLIQEDTQMEMVAGIDVWNEIPNKYPVYASLKECQEVADVIIDFASVKGIEDLLAYCIETKTPCVICTTGITPEQNEKIVQASKETAILKSANMSLGINMLLKLLKEASQVLTPAGFDIEVVEKHHKQKVDAPSGTALALADAINEAQGQMYEYVYDRSQTREKRKSQEIGFSAVRGGTIVGEHDVIFAGVDEVITFSHTAYSKTVFAKGAIEAAKFLHGKSAGFYQMSDVINQ